MPRRLLGWRDHPARLSRTAPQYALDRFTECKAAFLAAGFLERADTYTLWGYGSTGRALMRALRAAGKRASLIVEMHPGRIGRVIHGATVVRPETLATLPRQPLVASVAGARPRAEIRTALASMGFVELRDFVCAA